MSYSHAVSLSFEISSPHEFPTHEELLTKIKQVIESTPDLTKVVEVFDSEEE